MIRRPVGRRPNSRRGVTLFEATVAILVIVGVVIVAMPLLVKWRERGRRISCEANLHQIGQTIQRFQAADREASFPRGATYRTSDNSSGNSWWLRTMPYTNMKEFYDGWKSVPNEGDFGAPGTNPNILAADGYQQTVFFCPSSPLPLMNNPAREYSEGNKQALEGRTAKGIAVPMYAAVAGSAPDAKDANVANLISLPHGRNTEDGPFGILSSSGTMPVNLRIAEAAVSDSKDKTILIVEQSNWFENKLNDEDPPDQYDPRSAWPKGAFMGSTANYRELGPRAEGVSKTGDARVWNVTTIRYAINDRTINRRGIVVDPVPPRPAKKGDPVPEPPPYPKGGYGPGHNHGVISAHPGGAHVLMADGSVDFLNEEMSVPVLIELSTRDDGLDSGDF